MLSAGLAQACQSQDLRFSKAPSWPPKEQINALFLAQCYRVPQCLPISEFASDKSKGPQGRQYGSPGEWQQIRRGAVVEKGVDKRGLEV